MYLGDTKSERRALMALIDDIDPKVSTLALYLSRLVLALDYEHEKREGE